MQVYLLFFLLSGPKARLMGKTIITIKTTQTKPKHFKNQQLKKKKARRVLKQMFKLLIKKGKINKTPTKSSVAY